MSSNHTIIWAMRVNSARQNWLLGAGVSADSNIPLMGPLTSLVLAEVQKKDNSKGALLNRITDDLPDEYNIEHALSHLSDLIAVAERSAAKQATLGDQTFPRADLIGAHEAALEEISLIIRYGARRNEDVFQFGKPGISIVSVEDHRKFISALFESSQAGLGECRPETKNNN